MISWQNGRRLAIFSVFSLLKNLDMTVFDAYRGEFLMLVAD